MERPAVGWATTKRTLQVAECSMGWHAHHVCLYKGRSVDKVEESNIRKKAFRETQGHIVFRR